MIQIDYDYDNRHVCKRSLRVSVRMTMRVKVSLLQMSPTPSPSSFLIVKLKIFNKKSTTIYFLFIVGSTDFRYFSSTYLPFDIFIFRPNSSLPCSQSDLFCHLSLFSFNNMLFIGTFARPYL